jgi:hypothetical protein
MAEVDDASSDSDSDSDSDYVKYIPFNRQLFDGPEDISKLLEGIDEFTQLLALKEALVEIWRLIELNPANNTVSETFPYKTMKDASKSHYKKRDYWLSFLNQFFCASFESWQHDLDDNEDFKKGFEEVKQVMINREVEIGLTTTQRNGRNGWFKRLCFGVKLETGVVIDNVPIFIDDKDYQPFLSSRDSFAERLQAMMFDLIDLECYPGMNFAYQGATSPY